MVNFFIIRIEIKGCATVRMEVCQASQYVVTFSQICYQSIETVPFLDIINTFISLYFTSSTVQPTWQMIQSSAYKFAAPRHTYWLRLFTNERKSVGPKTNPWGTQYLLLFSRDTTFMWNNLLSPGYNVKRHWAQWQQYHDKWNFSAKSCDQ